MSRIQELTNYQSMPSAAHVIPALSRDVYTPAVTRRHINAVDSRIAYLVGCIRKLQQHRYILKAHLDAYVYPVLTLPNEIISEIFLHCVSFDRTDPIPSPQKAPLLLGQICHLWREIALSTPSLWNMITLDIIKVDAYESQLRLLDMWLTRSRASPLTISLFYRNPQDPDGLGPIYGGSAILNIPFADLILIEGDMPLLEELALGITDMFPLIVYPPDPSWPVQRFDHAPKLTDVIFLRGLEPTVFTLPWAQLTHISVRDTEPRQVVDVLRSAMNVIYLNAELVWSSDTDALVAVPAVPPLAHLEILYLTGALNHASHRQILEKLTLPALVLLTVSERCFGILEGPEGYVQELIARSECETGCMHITVTDAWFTGRHYRRAWPAVHMISVEHPDDGNDYSAGESSSGSDSGGGDSGEEVDDNESTADEGSVGVENADNETSASIPRKRPVLSRGAYLRSLLGLFSKTESSGHSVTAYKTRIGVAPCTH
ncbi:hypothetical protein C8R43DRAFT_958278 [Mycena crocata]|nr:hypothetical protein C8R43DRAFT_958278 [Mycena crocata]